MSKTGKLWSRIIYPPPFSLFYLYSSEKLFHISTGNINYSWSRIFNIIIANIHFWRLLKRQGYHELPAILENPSLWQVVLAQMNICEHRRCYTIHCAYNADSPKKRWTGDRCGLSKISYQLPFMSGFLAFHPNVVNCHHHVKLWSSAQPANLEIVFPLTYNRKISILCPSSTWKQCVTKNKRDHIIWQEKDYEGKNCTHC